MTLPAQCVTIGERARLVYLPKNELGTAALEAVITRVPPSTTCPQTSDHYRPTLTSGTHNVVDQWTHPCWLSLDDWRTDMAQLAEHSLDEEPVLQT